MTEDKTPSVHALGMTKSVGGKAKKSKAKGRKVGRNKLSCLRYKLEHRREKNKLRRLTKHIKKHLADQCAVRAADLCKVTLGLR
jgi:hypothetical protein